MTTKILDEKNITDKQFQELKSIILAGGLIVFPTETVYGLGGNGLDQNASKKIYEAKGRPSDNPLILHISNLEMLKKITKHIPHNTYPLIEAFWPGPLTFVFEKSDLVPITSTGGLQTVAVRMPNHPLALRLIETCEVPLAAPSANLSGRPSSTEFSHVYEDLNERVDIIINGGDSVIGLESTVLDMTTQPPMILRPGKVTQEMIESILQQPILVSSSKDVHLNKSPGTKYAHYQPKAPMVLLKGNLNEIKHYLKDHLSIQDGIISFDEFDNENNVFYVQSDFQSIYKSLRLMDRNDVHHIWLVASQFDHYEEAVKDRLLKASHGEVIAF